MLEISDIARFLNLVMKSKKGDAVKLWKLSAHRAFASRSGPIPLPDLLVLGKQFFHTFSPARGEGER
jgi:hypothetical protein